eukprot:XP_015577846.1 uncharacterized protein LOC107261649 [Ricinus communis]
MAHWSYEKFQRKHVDASMNRRNDTGGEGSRPPLHTRGLISMVERAKRMAAKGSTEPSEPDTTKLSLQVAGGEKKRRVYGMGAKAPSFFSHGLSYSSTSRFEVTDVLDPLEMRVIEIVQ